MDMDLERLIKIVKQDEANLQSLNQKIYECNYEIKHIKDEIISIKQTQATSGIYYFIKQNWWKIGGFILTFATILGAIGEFLYRLPPPK